MKLRILLLIIAFNISVFSQSFYDEGTIQEIRITFEQSNWDALMDAQKAGDGDYIMASLVSLTAKSSIVLE